MVSSRKLLTPLLAVAGAIPAVSGCRQESKVERPAIPVRVETVSPAGSPGGMRYSANVQPNEQVSLAFKSSGYVREILKVRSGEGRSRNLQAGDTVARGTVLARVRESDYVEKVNQARASLAEASAAARRERLDFDRAKSLFDSKSLAKADFDGARSALDAAEARVAGARAQLDAARIALADCALTSPMNALVLGRNVEEGTLVSAGTVGFTLADLSSVKAVFGVPDIVVRSLRIGQPLGVSVEAIPETRFNGRITAIAPSAERQSRVFDVEVTIPNPAGTLRSGMIAAVETPHLAGPGPSGEAAVPLTAVLRSPSDPDGYAVFVLAGDGENAVAKVRPVKLGEVVGNRIVVTSGLAAGERVVVTGATVVADGDRVRVIP
ncbi:MAG TPA: efflux RND transporter periplasmic adaptor subunit [Thermoanaerobaculia bacterium]|nr:efflux RND transporter periplasmic adaptor subunit [Thermoanaerobaculia bacterium]